MLNLYGTFAAGPSFQGLYGSTSIITPTTVLEARRAGVLPYYSNGFLEAGAGQTGSGLSSIIDFASTALTSILPRLGGGGGTSVPTRQPVPGSATRPPSEHMPGPLGGPGKRGRVARIGIPAAGAAVAYAGYHIIKKGPNAGQLTKNRHRNVGNIRALRRAISRLHGFERVCRKVVHFVKPHQKGRIVFKGRKKAR